MKAEKTKLFAVLAALVCAAIMLLSACEQKPKGPARVSGKVQRHGQGVPMAMVQFYPKAEQDRSTAPLAEVPSGADGAFSLEVPAGRYWVWAKATITEGGREARLVGEAVPNPLEPASGEETIIKIELSDPSGFSDSNGPEGTGVRGKIILPNDAGAAMVYIYGGTVEKPIGPGFLVAVDAPAGKEFRANLAPGKYTLAARQRKSGRDFGPPDEKDLVAVRHVEVSPGSYADAGEIALSRIDPKAWGQMTATMGASPTSIEGIILDVNSKPVEGDRVLAFRDGRMTGKPAFVSPSTGRDGKFVLPLSPEGGNFYLGARSQIGGPSSPGEKVGQNRGEMGSGITVKGGQKITGIKITVEEVW